MNEKDETFITKTNIEGGKVRWADWSRMPSSAHFWTMHYVLTEGTTGRAFRKFYRENRSLGTIVVHDAIQKYDRYHASWLTLGQFAHNYLETAVNLGSVINGGIFASTRADMVTVVQEASMVGDGIKTDWTAQLIAIWAYTLRLMATGKEPDYLEGRSI